MDKDKGQRQLDAPRIRPYFVEGQFEFIYAPYGTVSVYPSQSGANAPTPERWRVQLACAENPIQKPSIGMHAAAGASFNHFTTSPTGHIIRMIPSLTAFPVPELISHKKLEEKAGGH